MTKNVKNVLKHAVKEQNVAHVLVQIYVLCLWGESEPTGQIGDAFTMHCFAFMCCWIPDLIFCIPGTVVGTVVGSIEGFLQCCKMNAE